MRYDGPVTEFLRQVEQNLLDRCLLVRRQAVLVAVSGGLDSMALLHRLHQLASRHCWRLAVAHFNHRLRGRASAADEKLVRAAAAKLELPVIVGGADVRTFARKAKLSITVPSVKWPGEKNRGLLSAVRRLIHERSISRLFRMLPMIPVRTAWPISPTLQACVQLVYTRPLLV